MDGHLMPSQIEDGVLGSKAARGGGAQMTSLPALGSEREKRRKGKKTLSFILVILVLILILILPFSPKFPFSSFHLDFSEANRSPGSRVTGR